MSDAPRERPLTRNQRLFVARYVATEPRNATKAYAQVYGVSDEVAGTAAARLFGNVRIRSAIDRAERDIASAAKISAERVLVEIARIAFQNPADVFDFTGDEIAIKPASEIPSHARRTIKGIKITKTTRGSGEKAEVVERTELLFWSKDGALEKLGKHFGLFPERLTIADPSKLSDEELFAKLQEARGKLRLVG